MQHHTGIDLTLLNMIPFTFDEMPECKQINPGDRDNQNNPARVID
jgi:hypothetical protein